ncbi:MAG: BLUF domain-containing protein [Myxococcota bacterium]|nr:BLUF domain-containing protein [Myxococcota bacterium]
MALSQLIYVSRATRKLTLRDTMAILDAAKPNNEANGVTGLLAYGGGHFLQVLEGEGRQVTDTFARILRDARHEEAQIVDFSIIQARRFDDWSMHLINLDDPDRPSDARRPQRYRADASHPFFSTDPQVAFWMLYDLKIAALT